MLGSKIKELRKEHKLTQDKFARMIYVSRPTLSRWERNEAVPDSDQLTRIAGALQVSVEYLLNEDLTAGSSSETKSSMDNDDIVRQLVRINDTLAENISRRRENIKRVCLIILIILVVFSLMFAVLIICNMSEPGQGYGKDTVIYVTEYELNGG